jgi:ATP-binding cassette subfamily B protein
LRHQFFDAPAAKASALTARLMHNSRTDMPPAARSLSHAMGSYLRRIAVHRRPLAKILVLFPIKHSAYLFYPILIKLIIDRFIPARRLDLIFGTLGVVALLGVLNYFCHRAYTVCETIITKGVSRDLRNQIIEKLQILSLQYHVSHESGRFVSKLLVDVERTERFAEMLFNTLLASVITVVFSVAVLATDNWRMLLFYLLCIPFYLLVYRYFSVRFGRLQHAARMANEDLSQSLSQFIQTSFLSKLHGEEEFERKRIDERSVDIIQRQKSIRKTIASFGIITVTFSQVFTMLIVAVCATLVMRGEMLIGSLVLFLTYITQLTNTVTNIINQFPTITEFAESIYSIQEVLNAAEEEHNQGKEKPAAITGKLEFQAVDFAYVSGKPVFAGLSVVLERAATVALVGASGSGKTTFVNLALGLVQPQRGRILLDGRDLATLDMRHVRKQVGVVTQEPIIFRGTVYENIAHGREDYDKQAVHEAARRANAHDFIAALPDGYDTVVGERGATLSGGQKQRIAIARTIFRRPAILVLDEATSALDAESEREVQKGIDGLLGGQTTIVIAHRLSTIFRADRILVFDKGNIAESGTHDQLIDRRGLYASLLQVQMGLDERTIGILKQTGHRGAGSAP